MVKNTILTLLLTIGFSVAANAQRIAYVNVRAILESIAEYQEAQKELDELAARWRTEIAGEYDKIKAEYNRYQAEQVLLSDEARRAKEDEIMEMEKRVREMQKERFSPEGLLFEKRKELVQPIQDRIYGAIQDYADDRGYDFIFDNSNGASGIIFANPEYDKTNDIIDKIRK
ncbi:MAG TPA: OmpH family outer membrane protein [Bacteroidetes bacterium]|nr:OmpH family outer membrane protein [Bacteroidota bacterium]